jgi:NAD(P)-dependent dehydrogenase (short-subunit alcohol dehydrogenase family)
MMARPSSFDLEGRAVLVTGGSRSVGRAIAGALGRAGIAVAVTSRSLKALDATLAELKASGVEACAIEHNVASVDGCRTAVAAAAMRFGRLDILVNNAGAEQLCPSLEVDEALWDRILDTNLKGAFFSAQAAAARMKADGRGGVIINVCSLTSEVGVPTATPYGSSKSGLLGMTRALSAEWAPLNIRVNAIAPGYFQTDMTQVFYENSGWRTGMLRRIPQARFGEMSDLQAVSVVLASDKAKYIAGQCIAADGGDLASI